jgi:8-oxo-dGTP diphosphatase
LLPHLYKITPDCKPFEVDLFLQNIEHSLKKNKIKIIQLRTPSLDNERYQKITQKIYQKLESLSCLLILNNEYFLNEKINCDGFHLSAKTLVADFKKQKNKIYGASCHNEYEIKQAINKKMDYVFLSPVLKTNTHPDAINLGWDRFRKITQKCSQIKIYALGGMQKEDLYIAQKNGAYGVAAISAFL